MAGTLLTLMGIHGVFLWTNHDQKKEKKGKHDGKKNSESSLRRKHLRIQVQYAEAKARGISALLVVTHWVLTLIKKSVCATLHGCLTWLLDTPVYFPRVRYPISVSCQTHAVSSHTWLACSARADLDSFAVFRDAGSQCSQLVDRSL